MNLFKSIKKSWSKSREIRDIAREAEHEEAKKQAVMVGKTRAIISAKRAVHDAKYGRGKIERLGDNLKPLTNVLSNASRNFYGNQSSIRLAPARQTRQVSPIKVAKKRPKVNTFELNYDRVFG